ncbi:MAG: ribbon-helix-helix protein, CopG family [Myxococcales bacterium]|nr:ribbon-helix-helix protein, CopG family [Myxococcales bacterium]
MKTAISLSDDLFRKADLLAKRLGKSRSKLYQEAVAEYVARHSPESISRAIDQVLEKVPNPPDRFVKRAGALGLRRIEWEE